ncbi:MAG: type II secretion system secretin GspD, partial [Armatimonadetes bacterium]|nr:type II secretion system secretin GspD [Armatimonadota bacterium]
MFLRTAFSTMPTPRVDTKGCRWRASLGAVALALTLTLDLGILAPVGLAAGPPRARATQPPRQPVQATPPTADAKLEVVPGAGGTDMISMEFYDLDIDHVLRLLSHTAQVTIVKSEQVTGPVTVIAPEPVPLEVAFQILDSVLEVRGFTMVRTPTGIYKVIPIAEAIESGVPLRFGERFEDVVAGDQLVTQVIPLQNVDANDLSSQLQNLLSETASIVPTSTNSLIITDTAANVARALLLIEDVESQLAGGLKVYALQYYDATEMAELVDSIVLSRGGAVAGGARPAWERRVVGRADRQPRATGRPTAQQGATGAGPEFAYPDARTNSLVVLATPIHLRQIEDLITQLDRPVSLRDAFFVYPVQNLVASELAELVAPLIGAEVVKSSTGTQATSRTTGTAGQRTGSYTRPFGTTSGSGIRSISSTGDRSRTRLASEPQFELDRLSGESASSGTPVSVEMAQAGEAVGQVAPQPQPPAPPQPPGGAPEDLTAVTGASVAEAIIAADDNTNILLISAPPEQLDLLQQMLEKLDVLPPQVHIRAIIAEVALERDTSLGFQWKSLGRTWGVFEDDVFTGNVGTGFGLAAPVEDSTPVGFFATLSGSEFQAVLNALTTDSKARILSAPSIFTANNQEATIDISQQLPFPTGTFQTTTDVGTISTSISYKSVGIVLNVVPRVTQGGVVRMEIEISANEPGQDVVVAGLDYPSFSQRLATAVISVQDGDTVVLGGLMRETISRSSSRVPILGDIPLVGALFRSSKSERLKSELLLFLTPQVVRTYGASAELTAAEASRLPDIPKSLREATSATEEEPEGVPF